MLAEWILVRINRDLDTTRLMYAVLEAGRTVRVADYENFIAELDQSSDDACVVVFGSIAATTEVMKRRKWIPGSWHTPEVYACKNYYAAWGRYITQQRHVLLTLSELTRRHEELFDLLGGGRALFIRPDESEKIFDGKLVKREFFEGWRTAHLAGVPDDTICVAASPVEISAEYRLVIRRGTVVTGSVYRIAGSIEIDPVEGRPEAGDLIRFAEKVANDNPPRGLPPVYLMDVALHPDGGFSVLEVQSISAAGLYRCDLVKLALAVSEEAEAAWRAGRGEN